ncbi:MAG: hypothetical protein ACHQQQ_14945 [Bacteroidota bacterium]
MYRYMVSIPHSMEDCVRALKTIESAGLITHSDWGCKDGAHTGWVILEAESKSQAMMVVPALLREKAQVVQLVKFSPEEVRLMHG